MTITYQYRHLGKPNPVHRATEPATAPIGQEAPATAEPAHTPTPWHHGVANRGIVWSGTKIKSHIVANCYDDTTTSEQQQSDAALIVKAVNAHHTLWDRIRKVEHDNEEAAARIHRLEACLDECLEYIALDTEVIDYGNGEPMPNKATRLCQMIEQTLGEGR